MKVRLKLKIAGILFAVLGGSMQAHATSDGILSTDVFSNFMDGESISDTSSHRRWFDDWDNAIGAVFVATNAAPDNEVVMYHQELDGTLSLAGQFLTGGTGSGPGQVFRGDALGSQNSMIVSGDNRFLLVVNFLSNDVSVFRIRRNRLVLTDVELLDGTFPVAIAEHEGVVYALTLDSGGGRIQGFTLDDSLGDLEPMDNSIRFLNSGSPDPATDPTFVVFTPSDLLFSPNGRQLVVIVKGGPTFEPFNAGNGRIQVFTVDSNGLPTTDAPTETDTLGDLPFAAVFDNNGHLIVVEALGGPPLGAPEGTAAISSFDFNADGSLQVITESLPLGALDTCWVVRDNDLLYTANFFSDSISSLRVHRDGSISLLDTNAGTTPEGSFNLDLLAQGGYLYNILPGEGAIAGYRLDGNGRMRSIGLFTDALEATPDQEPQTLGADGGSPAGMAGVLF